METHASPVNPAGIQGVRGINPGAKMIFAGALQQRREQGSTAGGTQRVAANFRDGPGGNASQARINGWNASRDDRHFRPGRLSKSGRTAVLKPMFNLGAKGSGGNHNLDCIFAFYSPTISFDSG